MAGVRVCLESFWDKDAKIYFGKESNIMSAEIPNIFEEPKMLETEWGKHGTRNSPRTQQPEGARKPEVGI